MIGGRIRPGEGRVPAAMIACPLQAGCSVSRSSLVKQCRSASWCCSSPTRLGPGGGFDLRRPDAGGFACGCGNQPPALTLVLPPPSPYRTAVCPPLSHPNLWLCESSRSQSHTQTCLLQVHAALEGSDPHGIRPLSPSPPLTSTLSPPSNLPSPSHLYRSSHRYSNPGRHAQQ